MPVITKGATPIIKNIIVVDEQGNKYEATYPKRAKGLVKNSRARFINENTICLACPPNEYLEDNKMENKLENKLTEREIFEQIVSLQKQLAENSNFSLHRLEDTISSLCSDNDEVNVEQISEICNVFSQREHNIRLLIDLYNKMYDDVKKNDEVIKAELVKNMFAELINGAELLPPIEKEDFLTNLAKSIPETIKNCLQNKE